MIRKKWFGDHSRSQQISYYERPTAQRLAIGYVGLKGVDDSLPILYMWSMVGRSLYVLECR